MALHLTIIKSPAGMTPKEDRKTITDSSVIGRSAKSDWVLNDPDRFLSSRHCEIQKDGNQFYLVDLSTNGTFLNGAQEPLGREARVALSHGDSFDVGDYRFKVGFESDASPFGASPFETPQANALDESTSKPNSGFGKPSGPAPESMYMSSAYSGMGADIAPDAMKVVDPLIALNITPAAAPTPRTNDSILDDSQNKSPFFGSQEDSADFLHASADWPQSKSEDSVIPEDWADDISILGAQGPSQIGVDPVSNAYKLPDNDSLIVSRPDPSITPRPAPVAPKPAPQTSAAVAPTPAPRPSDPVSPSGGSSLDRTLVDALGFSHLNLSDDQIRHIHMTVGVMTRETLEGLMQILRSRTSIKNEFRINITTIQPVENNPLKFSANVDEVLENMFLKDSRAYKKPIEAVQESFNTIADHQVAVIAGIRSAFKSVLTQFDPVALEETFKDSGKAGMLGSVMKGKLWSAYQAHYQSIVNNMERSFQELFGDDFVQAYEDQLRKLSNARKRGK